MKNKLLSILFLLSIIRCDQGNEKGFDGYNRENKFQVTISSLKSKDFVLSKEASDNGMNIYVSNKDSIMIILDSKYDATTFQWQFEEQYYRTLDSLYKKNDLDFTLDFSREISKDKVILKRIIFDKIELDGIVPGNYMVSYVYTELDNRRSIDVLIRKEFPRFDLLKSTEWAKRFDDIQIIHH